VTENPKFCPACGAATALRTLKPGDPPRAVCGGCSKVHYTGPRLAAGAVCTLGGRIVLVRRSIEPGYGLWVYPGGFVDIGESPRDAAVREAREEAGVDLRLGGLLGVYHNAERAVVVVVYTGEVVKGAPTARDEALEARLFARREIPWDELAFSSTREALRDFLGADGGRRKRMP
jgi:ADP-ribose pyrophosphatase YjhB (NUDIX family)